MGFTECCSSFVAGLPDPAVPLLPSLLLGTGFAAVFLIIVYKKQSKMTLKAIFVDIGKTLFCLMPSHDIDHPKTGVCQNPNCFRCQKYRELQLQIIKRFKTMELKQLKIGSSRIKDAVQSVARKIRPVLDGPESSPKELEKEKITKNLLGSSFQKPTIFSMDLPANPYWNDYDVYALELELLKLNFKIILGEFQEALNIFKRDSSGWKLNDIPSGHWCIFPFIDQGIVNEANCKRCPNTATMIGSLPSVMKGCVFGNASFSMLYPDSHIEPHHGPTNLRLRCHLGLSIPDGCWLEVAGTQYKWKPQEAIVFDDSFEHSATFVNKPNADQDMPRAILMIDFWHPDVSADEKKVLLELLAP